MARDDSPCIQNRGSKDPEEQVRTKEIKEQKKMLKKDQEFRPSDKQLEDQVRSTGSDLPHSSDVKKRTSTSARESSHLVSTGYAQSCRAKAPAPDDTRKFAGAKIQAERSRSGGKHRSQVGS